MSEWKPAIVFGLTMLALGILSTAAGMIVVDYFLFELGFPIAFMGALIALVGTLGWAKGKSRKAPQSPRPPEIKTEKGEV